MAICIAGMHRSGTSMITHLLYQCGLFLGPDEQAYSGTASDNPEGFWEHSDFLRLNDAILQELGGGWDFLPDMTPGWELRPELLHLRVEAARILQPFEGQQFWGWKDPRSSLTLPFWKQLLPRVQVLVCVRNPLEVIRSLHKRGYASLAFGQPLWLEYNRRLLASVRAEQRLVTHIDIFFHEPQAELQRILTFLQMPATPDVVAQACSVITPRLRHHRLSLEEMLDAGLSAEVMRCYMDLCAQAGPVYQRVLGLPDEPCASEETTPGDLRGALRQARLRGEIARLQGELGDALARLHQLENQLRSRRYGIADALAHWYGPLRQGWLKFLAGSERGRAIKPRASALTSSTQTLPANRP